MRNKYPGTCYKCYQRVEAGGGHFERYRGGWRVQHSECAILYRDVNCSSCQQRINWSKPFLPVAGKFFHLVCAEKEKT